MQFHLNHFSNIQNWLDLVGFRIKFGPTVYLSFLKIIALGDKLKISTMINNKCLMSGKII